MKTLLLLGMYLLLCSHEFWISPDKYHYRRAEPIAIRFHQGENFTGENWTGNGRRIKNMHFYFANVKDSCHMHLGEEEGDSLVLAMVDEGTAMVTMETHDSYLELPAPEFEAYLKTQQFHDALRIRKEEGDSSRPGKELYRRSCKTLVQVGNDRDRTYKTLTDLPIDIIPDDHPYLAGKDDRFKVRVLYKRTILANHPVRVWHRLNNKTSVQDHVTDENGEFKFFFTPSGEYLISAVKIERLKNDPRADWQSYWGSLTWGYK